jgi:hypothetical protein
MRRKLSVTLSVLLVGFGAAASAVAHHSFAAEFDVNMPVRLKGKVTRIEFTNPHCWIYLDVTTESGALRQWMIEGGAPNVLLRRGWNRNSLPIGTEVSVLGYRARDNSLKASGNMISLADGKVLFMGSDRPQTAAAE